jgi:gas vesicle protein
MSQQDNFVPGFLLGTLVGGIVGGVVGVLVSSRLNNADASSEAAFAKLDEKASKGRKRQLKAPPTEQSIEMARRGLEDKIAQLNEAIDDVRQQLGGVNGGTRSAEERAVVRDN